MGDPPVITKADLRPGDVIMWQGNSTLSKVIRALDAGTYSHASIWSGDALVEATKQGVLARPLEDDLGEENFGDAYRFVSGSHTLGDKGWPAEPVIDRAMSYVGRAYGWDDLWLMALLVACSRMPSETNMRIILTLIGGELVGVLKQEGVLDPNTMVCTQVVASAFWDADAEPGNKYGIAVTLDGRLPNRDAYLCANSPPILQPPGGTPLAAAWAALTKLCQHLLLRSDFVPPAASGTESGLVALEAALQAADLRPDAADADVEAEPAPPPGSTSAYPCAITTPAGGCLLPAATITPRDFETSPSLKIVGRLAKDA